MCIVTMKTMTKAIRGRNAVERAGIQCEIVSLDKTLTKNGCAYGISFPCSDVAEVKGILGLANIGYGVMIGDSRD